MPDLFSRTYTSTNLYGESVPKQQKHEMTAAFNAAHREMQTSLSPSFYARRNYF
ncbi:hypothetical protein [Sphingobium sp. HWE2-09]|uniref:hypothetical protein n=1 Tax=Sphingobium sp. HWE2-09 TaxID=3108390 RepID=UPI002DC990D4|nr:hypothetical protein [Sphingobium sp. HWE2-09]